MATLLLTFAAVVGATGCGSRGQVSKSASRGRPLVVLGRPSSPVRKPSFHLTLRDPSYRIAGINRAQVLSESGLGQTVPLWQSSAAAFGKTYPFTIVGPNPFVHQPDPAATIGLDLVPVKVEFMGSSNQVVETFDPNAANTDCGLPASPTQLVAGSPLFQPASYQAGGTNIGTGQYLDAYMREEFAGQVFGLNATNPGYGITLKLSSRPEVTVAVPFGEWVVLSASQSGACGGQPGGDVGLISLPAWDNYVQQTLIGQLQRAGETAPTDMLNFLFANVVMCYGNATSTADLSRCAQSHQLAAGYHLGLATQAGMQYYDTADFDATGVAPDIGPMSHELAEWLNDPNGDNATPPWGGTGQVSGCQGNLEVGDPLTGHVLTVTMPSGASYHPQELAFLSWFYREAPSASVNGWYSSNHTFTSAPSICAGATSPEVLPPVPGHARPFGP